MGKRRKGREIVLQSLYASLINGGDVLVVLEDQLLRRESAPETVAFARDLARKIKAHRPDTEAWLKTLISARWDPSRLGSLELCILYLGLTELKHSPEVPFRAVINEACELARRYCEDGAIGFVNGVLDRAAHQVYPDAAVAPSVDVLDDDDDDADAGSPDAGDLNAGDPDAGELDADFGDTPLRGDAAIDPGKDR